MPVVAGFLDCYGIEFGIIIKREIDSRVFYRISIDVFYYNFDCACGGIVFSYIYDCGGRFAFEHFLRAVIASENFGIHQHTA